MFGVGIGLGELVVIAVAALLLTKPGELGALARKAGRFLASLRSAREELEGALGELNGEGMEAPPGDADGDRPIGARRDAPGDKPGGGAGSSTEGDSHDRRH